MKTNILVGNTQEWRNNLLEALGAPQVQLSPDPLTAKTIELAQVDIVLPFELAEYDEIRISEIGSKKCIIPDEIVVLLANDKLLFNNWLISVGFGHCVPKMFPGESQDPVIRKRRIDQWGLNSRIFASHEDMRTAGVDLKDCDYIIQECITGCDEYVTHTISIAGMITYAATLRNVHDTALFIKGQEQPRGVESLGNIVPPELSAILKLLNYSGCACFNYKIVNGTPMIFEMNPRVGGTFYRVADQYCSRYIDSVNWNQKHGSVILGHVEPPKSVERFVKRAIRDQPGVGNWVGVAPLRDAIAKMWGRSATLWGRTVGRTADDSSSARTWRGAQRTANALPDTAAFAEFCATEGRRSGEAEIVRPTDSFQDRIIRQHVAGLSFIDVGGLWGTLNEKVTVAGLSGARSTAMADIHPLSSSLWQDFRKRCAEIGVSGYSEISVNLDDLRLREKIGCYDFVHCSGIIYHAPSPLFSIAQLRTISNRYLLLGSMVVPEHVTNEAGSLDFSGGEMMLVPAIDASRRAVMAQHFDASGIRIAHINADQPSPFRVGGMPNYSPWWWLYSASTLRAMVEVSGFKVLAQGPYWNERVSYCFCVKTNN